MKSIVVKPVAAEPEEVTLYPDFLIGLLRRAGDGMLEAEARDWSQPVPILLTGRHP